MRAGGSRPSPGRARRSVAVGGAVFLLWLAPMLTAPLPEPSVEQGRELYRVYCRSCHGESARGDGPTAAALKVAPADLTALARDNDGEFPAARVHDAIDGRPGLLSHGTREMPVWGLAFQQFDTDIDQERQVSSRIRSLVLYLESIQPVADSAD